MKQLWGWPINSWLILTWFALACINTHNTLIWRAAKRGELPEGDEQPPNWLAQLLFWQYAVLAYLAYLDWRQALSVYLLTFLAAVFSPVLELIGGVLLIPLALIVHRSQ